MKSGGKATKDKEVNGSSPRTNFPDSFNWGSLVPPTQWAVYKKAIQAAREVEVPFMLGGAFGLARYTGRWRNTKDIDFFVRESDRDRLVSALHRAGFVDYHRQLAYDRSWIYRATQDGVIVDVIWTTPNHHMVVDEEWFEHAQAVTLCDEELRVVPAEELLWIKIFVLQRDRCDWPDLINLLSAVGADLDWDRLQRRLANDLPLLHAVLLLFAWVCPAGAAALPSKVRRQFRLPENGDANNCAELEQKRVALLDSRPWYASFQSQNEPMQL